MKEERLAVCLAGGVDDDGSLPLHAERRVKKAVELFRKGAVNKIIFTTGATHRGVSKFLESEAMRIEAINLGVDPDKIICETMSRDTYGNAVFTRALYIDPKGIKKFSVITSGFHMPKTKLLFNHVYPKNQGYSIKFIEVSDSGLDENALKKRLGYEKFSCRFYKYEILPEVKPGDIKKQLLIWHLERNPSHTLAKNLKFKKLEGVVNKKFIGDPLY